MSLFILNTKKLRLSNGRVYINESFGSKEPEPQDLNIPSEAEKIKLMKDGLIRPWRSNKIRQTGIDF